MIDSTANNGGRSFVVVGLFVMVACPIAVADWPSWRGPHQDGTIEAPGQFSGKSFGLEILWKKPIGSGYSGISVASGKVLTMFTDGVADFLGAFDAHTGRELWRHRMGGMYEGHDGGHDGPVSTPIVDEGTVYALGADGRLVAVGLGDGALRWRVDLVERLHARAPYWGFTTSPVIIDDVLVVQAGAPDGKALAAFDKRSGAFRWARGNGTVDYRSPVLARLHGRRQLLVSTSERTSGVDPATGETLWTIELGSSNSGTPLAIGADLVLIPSRSGAIVIQVPADGEKPKMAWQSDELRGNYAAPVFYEGHLYGFTGRYLTCVDAKTGVRRWRSRQPGGKGIIAVGGHLVLFGAKGDVVVAKISPDAYLEEARLNVSDADGYSWPSFADGIIFVRNLRHLVAVRTTSVPVVETVSAPPSNRFEAFIRELQASQDKPALLDEFMKTQSSFPIVEDGRLVHFVYRGDVEDVAILGSMLASGEEDPLRRVEGTNLFHRSYPIEPGSRWEYRFNLDFDHIVPDPLNPRRTPEDGRAVSEVVTPGWQLPGFAQTYAGSAAGRVESFQLIDMETGGRRIRVYLPHGYDGGQSRHPVVIMTDGREWMGAGAMTGVLDHLVESSIQPPIVAFVHPSPRGSGRELGGGGTREYARMLSEKLVPELDRRYRTRPDPAERIILGKRGAAVSAVYAALAYPQVFGHCVAISYGRADTVRHKLIAGLISGSSGGKPRFYVAWNRYDIWRPQSFDVREQSRELTERLKGSGFEVLGGERLDGAGWVSWRILAGQALQALLPKP